MEQSYVIRNDRVIGKTVPNINYNYSTCPIGSIFAFSSERIPLGFFICDGASYKVAEYPDLYAVIGNTYGGDDVNFNVPNLVDKFIQGSTTSGTEKEAGLPNIEGSAKLYIAAVGTAGVAYANGAMYGYEQKALPKGTIKGEETGTTNNMVGFDASKSNPIYGNSDTVQPPALTMVYIIKAFHTNEGVDSGVSDDIVEYVAGEIDKKAAIDDTQASTETTWSSEKIASELGGKVYTSLAELGLTADATIENVIKALPIGGRAIISTHEFTNYQTLFPYSAEEDKYATLKVEKGYDNTGSRTIVTWVRKDASKIAYGGLDATNAVRWWNEYATKSYVDRKHNYSTTETAVGTWIDGKTIYRNTFTKSPTSDQATGNQATINVATISGLTNVIDIQATAKLYNYNKTSAPIYAKIPFSEMWRSNSGSASYVDSVYVEGTALKLHANNCTPDDIYYVTVEYTK